MYRGVERHARSRSGDDDSGIRNIAMLDNRTKQNTKSIAAIEPRAHRDEILRSAIIIEIERGRIVEGRHILIVIDAGKRREDIARYQVRTAHYELIRVATSPYAEHGKQSNPINRVFHFEGLHGSFVVSWSARIVSGDLFQSPRNRVSPRYAV